MNPLIIQYYWRTIKYKKDPGILKFLDKLRGIDEEKQKYIGIKGYGDPSSQQMKTMFENENEFIVLTEYISRKDTAPVFTSASKISSWTYNKIKENAL